MTFAHTVHGRGRIVESSSVHGRTEYKVEGPGFSRWFEATELGIFEDGTSPAENVNTDNSVALPYDPEPQALAHDEISTILPAEDEIDPEERTSGSDSLSGNSADGFDVGDPNPDLFASGNGEDPTQDFEWDETSHHSDTLMPGNEKVSLLLTSQLAVDPRMGRYTVVHQTYGDHFSTDNLKLAKRVQANPSSFSEGHRIAASRAEGTDLDPYISLLRTSATMRESAWADVRAKALRLRREGKVDTVDTDTKSIAAMVQGDHGLYETYVIRQGHLTGDSGISEWSCQCEWGKHAFLRTRTYVGRLCSHAYAAYLELQSLQHKRKNSGKGKGPNREPNPYTYDPYDEPLREDDRDDYRNKDGLTEEEAVAKKYHSRKRTAADKYDPWPDNKTLRMEPDGYTPELNDLVKVNHETDREDLTDLGAESDYRERMEEPGIKDKRVASLSDDALVDRFNVVTSARDLAPVVGELRARGYDTLQMLAEKDTKQQDMLWHQPFNGTGRPDSLEYQTSADYIDSSEYKNDTHEEVDLGDDGEYTNPAEQNEDEITRQASLDEINDPIVAEFQRTAGWIMESSPSNSSGDDDIANAAQSFLRTAGRVYSFGEQQELIDERAPGGAANLDGLDLEGTHYLM